MFIRYWSTVPFPTMAPRIPAALSPGRPPLRRSSDNLEVPRLTARQQQILDWIRSHMEANGMPPTRAEIATGLGFSTASSAEDHLQALAKKGAIEITPALPVACDCAISRACRCKARCRSWVV